ncbi:MFS transporter [Actinopolymorpha alba]|uniref:MFS transporter n=1 Tax=Actinopolymorpha alba TaxID=533267 RepID=UPI0003762CCB|nr:MFS transporter [Actinopolymorpha alba]
MRNFFRQWSVLARYPNFTKLFIGGTTSLLGSNITAVAMPLTAVLMLDASPAQVGLLGAVGFVPHLVLGLPAGVWLGRASYRRTLVIADLTQMLLLATIPLLAMLDALRIWHLYLVVLLTGVCSLFGTVATTSFVPALVGRDHLLQANTVSAQSNSVVSTVGSALGGTLVQLLTAPIAILVDAVSFLLSALCNGLIREPGPAVASEEVAREEVAREPQRRRLAGEIAGGIGAVFGHPILRPLIVAAALGALAGQMQNVILVLFLAREVGLSPSLVGAIVAVSGVASIVGALAAAPITERIGHGPGFILGGFLAAIAGFGLAAAAGPMPLVLGVLVLAQVLRGAGPPLYGINQVTVRQALAAPDMLARVNATWRFLVFGTQPIGALLGGAAGGLIGLRVTFVASSLGMLFAVAVAVWSPLRTFRRLPGEGTAA